MGANKLLTSRVNYLTLLQFPFIFYLTAGVNDDKTIAIVDIEYKNEKLRKTCNESKVAIREYGAENANKLRRRLDDVRAASSLEIMRNLPGRCHELKGDRKGQLTLDLKHPLRLVFEACGPDVKNKEDGGLDWSSVKAVRIIGIEDTHE